MSDFNKFKKAIQKQLTKMAKTGLWKVEVSDKNEIWDEYLLSFPEGTNPIYRERTEHDCNCCKQFIRDIGNVVTIVDGEMVSVWDIEIDNFYQEVADELSSYISKKPIKNMFLHYQQKVGTDHNHGHNEDGSVTTYDHFYYELPAQFVASDAGPRLSQSRSDYEVLTRSLEEISLDSALVVEELIEQGSLYRGEEHKSAVKAFIKAKKAFDSKELAQDKKLFCWGLAKEMKGAGRFRNTVIGTMMVDLSEGKDLEFAVKSFETKVAPTNYKRPTALVTQGMIDNAQKKVEELGIQDSLQRRYAHADDLTINNVIFADRTVRKEMNAFDMLRAETKVKPQKMDKVEEVSIDTFINDLVPKAESIEVLFENRMKNNLVSLIAPSVAGSPNILKWGNNFSWAYNGDITDSIKERVKAAGGAVDGVLRTSLAWSNSDDLDIHVYEPNGNHISFSAKSSSSTGELDIDMNAGGRNNPIDPVENVIWTNPNHMVEGVYTVRVNNYSKRNSQNKGFEVQLEAGNFSKVFVIDQNPKDSCTIEVVKFKWTRAGGVEIIESIGDVDRSEEAWGVNTATFVPVKMVMNSPNHWDGEQTGNKHWFFMLEGCNNPEKARGFFNEYLKPELNEHRKVFEVLGAKLKAQESDNQLSGLGFSSTQRNSALFKIKGSFSRTVKVNF